MAKCRLLGIEHAQVATSKHVHVREPMVITQNGEGKAVLQDIASFEETQETLALLKILALGNQDLTSGKLKPMAHTSLPVCAPNATPVDGRQTG